MTDSKLPLCTAQQNSNLERTEPATTIEKKSRKQLINCSMNNMDYGVSFILWEYYVSN